MEDPGHRAARDLEGLGDGPEAMAFGSEAGHLVSVEYPPGPTNGLAGTRPLGAGPAEPRLDALPDQLPLELRHGADDGEHHPPRRTRQVELLPERDEADSEVLELFQAPDKMGQAPSESVKRSHHDGVHLPCPYGGHEPVDTGTPLFPARNAEVHVLFNDLESSGGSVSAQVLKLCLWILVLRRHAGVQCYIHFGSGSMPFSVWVGPYVCRMTTAPRPPSHRTAGHTPPRLQRHSPAAPMPDLRCASTTGYPPRSPKTCCGVSGLPLPIQSLSLYWMVSENIKDLILQAFHTLSRPYPLIHSSPLLQQAAKAGTE